MFVEFGVDIIRPQYITFINISCVEVAKLVSQESEHTLGEFVGWNKELSCRYVIATLEDTHLKCMWNLHFSTSKD